MDCRLWKFSSKTLLLVAVCACILDMPQAFAAGQETKPIATTISTEDLTDVDSGEIQVAPSPNKSTSDVIKAKKRRPSSKNVRKIDVPVTIGATKSMRKGEAELDKIFASRSTTASGYVQYGPSANVATQTPCPVCSTESEIKTHETFSTSKSLVVNAPYVERSSAIVQTAALTPDMIEPTVSERYPLFEEDSLTQESAPLVDDLNLSTSKSDSIDRDSSKKNVADANRNETNKRSSKTLDASRNDLPSFFPSPSPTDARSFPDVVRSPVAFENRFMRYTGLFADFEWLGWQTDSVKQAYAITTNENVGVYDELSLRPSGSGYRGRLGLRSALGWDLTGGYTTFDADKSGNVKSDAGNLRVLSGKSVDEISVKSDVKLDVYDLEVGRWITREQFAVRPFVGFRWARLWQTQNVDFENGGVEEQGAEESVSTTFDDEEGLEALAKENGANDNDFVWNRSKSDMWGLRLGAEGSVALFRNLSVYGRGAATVAVGELEYQTASSFSDDESVVVRRGRKSCATPAGEAAIGLAWRRGGLEVKGGYEFNVWSNASYLKGRSSDFATSGLFAGIAWNN